MSEIQKKEKETADGNPKCTRQTSPTSLGTTTCLSISPTMRPLNQNVLILSTNKATNKPMVISFDGKFHFINDSR